MKINVLDKNGKIVEELTLAKSVFGIKPNAEIVAQYLRVYNAHQRQGTSSTKNRGEVSGGGKKPWKQKGTGRARQGSIRSPQWRHGGIVNGPKPKDWSLSMPKKMKRLAMLSVLSSKFTNNEILILDKLDLKKPSTKELNTVLTNLKTKGKTLIILPSKNDTLRKSADNNKYLKTSLVGTLNPYEVLNTKNILFVKESLSKLEEKLTNVSK